MKKDTKKDSNFKIVVMLFVCFSLLIQFTVVIHYQEVWKNYALELNRQNIVLRELVSGQNGLIKSTSVYQYDEFRNKYNAFYNKYITEANFELKN